MYARIYNTFHPAYHHNCIGKTYLIQLPDESEGVYLMVFGGYDEDGDTTVHLVDIATGHQWTDPIYVADPDNLTDSEMYKLLDPQLRGVEFVNLGPIQDITNYLEGPAVVQTTL
jgi:hypothetical protein